MKKWINEVRVYLNEEYTQHLHRRALLTEDPETLLILVKKAQKIWAVAVSEADQLKNQFEKLENE